MKINMRGYTGTVAFKWDMTQAEFSAMFAPAPDLQDLRDYLGAVFFGNFNLEFIMTEDGGYCNLFQYGAEDQKDMAYGYLEDGTPYEERYPISDEIVWIPQDRFDVFAENIENQIESLLFRHPEFIPDAMVPTNPDKWYPADAPYKISEITREA